MDGVYGETVWFLRRGDSGVKPNTWRFYGMQEGVITPY